MPLVKAVHYNPPVNNGKTRCGRKLARVTWRTDINDATCNRCLQLVKKYG